MIEPAEDERTSTVVVLGLTTPALTVPVIQPIVVVDAAFWAQAYRTHRGWSSPTSTPTTGAGTDFSTPWQNCFSPD